MRTFLLLALLLSSLHAQEEDLQTLSQDFWKWRAVEQPFTTDDIPRLERPSDFVVDWSAKTIERRRQELSAFEERWKNRRFLTAAPVVDEVDYRLLGSALARVRWELDIEQIHKTNPLFYIDQTLGSVYVLLLPPPPFSDERKKQLIARLNQMPVTIQSAEQNLTDMRQPYVRLAIAGLADIRSRCDTMTTALVPILGVADAAAFREAMNKAVPALQSFQSWLEARVEKANPVTAIGRENYLYFLRHVALMPFTPEELLRIGQEEWSRTMTFEVLETNRNKNVPKLKAFIGGKKWLETERVDEQKIREFLKEQHLLTVPPDTAHYWNISLPAYLKPFTDLGVTDDLTSPTRLRDNATSYIPEPGPNLGFFFNASAHDPRPIIVHEGIPGHYFQFVRSWHNPDLIRRHYYDSGANEGIGFYAEEMMLQAGLFDDSPHTRELIYSFMRLRALRVEVDVKLALGQFTLQQAAEYLHRTVPMDEKTALEEASLFASTPGQAISYQIGKTQIMSLLADVRRKEGEHFDLQRFHDFLWTNGNVPIALQKWELLGDAGDVPQLPH